MNVKLYVSALVVAGLASIASGAQQATQNPTPGNPNQSGAAQSVPAQTTPAQPDPGATQHAQPGQAPPAQGPNPASGTGSAVPVESTANSPEVSNGELRPVQGELEKKLDSKTAKAGDAVMVRTTEKATIADGVVIPKGSTIVGQVVDAQPAGKATENSKVTILFNRARLKDGRSVPIKTVLQSLAPAAGAETAGGSSFGNGSAAVSSSGSAPAASTGAGAPKGGSAVTPNAASSSSATAPMTANANAQAGNTAPVAGTVVAKQGNMAIKTTAVPGVLIAANADGQAFSNASGAIVGARQNVHLDEGTQVVIAVAAAGKKGTNTR